MKKFLKRLLTTAFGLAIAFGIPYNSSAKELSTFKESTTLDKEGNIIKVKVVRVERNISEDRLESYYCKTRDTDLKIIKYNNIGETVWETTYAPFTYSKDLAYVLIDYLTAAPYNDKLVEKLKKIGIEPKITGELKKTCRVLYRGECTDYDIKDTRKVYPALEFGVIKSYEGLTTLTTDDYGNIYMGVVSDLELHTVDWENCYDKLPKNGIYLDDPKRNEGLPSDVFRIIANIKPHLYEYLYDHQSYAENKILKYTKDGKLEKILYLDFRPIDVKAHSKYFYVAGASEDVSGEERKIRITVAKYDSNFNKVWKITNKRHKCDDFLHKVDNDIALDVDKLGNIYVVGEVYEHVCLPKEIYYNYDCPECRKCCGYLTDTSILLISKYDKNGNQIWERLYKPFRKEIECDDLQVISIGIDDGKLDIYGMGTLNDEDYHPKGTKFILRYNSNGDLIEEKFIQ